MCIRDSSCSGGRTEAAVAVWGSDVPYLQSVESYGEQAALRYASEAAFTAEEFREKILGIEPEADLTGDPESWLGTISYTDGGGVDEIAIGGAALTGVQMRSAFGLNSTQFTLEFADGAFHFSVLGYGHRVGMSQYGANSVSYTHLITRFAAGFLPRCPLYSRRMGMASTTPS